MSPMIPDAAPAERCADTAPQPLYARRAWQTPRVITGQKGSEIAAAEGLGDLLGDHFFVSS